MKVSATELPGVLLIDTARFDDERGWFRETYQSQRYAEAGLPSRFVQDNVSRSRAGVLRGLHFQHPRGQGKLVSVLEGEIWDVAVDVRLGSATFGRWTGRTLSAENHRQLYTPSGFAHGFAVTSVREALVMYKCTELYEPAAERTLRWDDPELAIRWPVEVPLVSDKDRVGLRLRELAEGSLPDYAPR